MMAKLDLHGKKHENVEVEVIRFIFKHEPPFEIVTGNSIVMREMVKNIINRYGFKSHPKNWTNHGCLIITDSGGHDAKEKNG